MAALSRFVFLLNLIHLILHISALDILSSGSSLSAERSSDVLRSPDGTFTCGFYNISTNASTFSIWFSKVPFKNCCLERKSSPSCVQLGINGQAKFRREHGSKTVQLREPPHVRLVHI